MTNTAAAVDFIKGVYGAPMSACPVFVCSLPNDKSDAQEPGEKRLMTRDLAAIGRFLEKWDRAGRGAFFSVGTLREDAVAASPGGSPRSKENVAELLMLHGDVDLKSVDIAREEIIGRLQALPLPPSIIVWSGRGVHCYWLLNEGVEATPETIERVEAANRQIADLIAGDNVADVCRLMRVPGTHNTKEGGFRPVEIVSARYNPRYELDDLEEMLARLAPIIRRKSHPAGLPALQSNPFLAVASLAGFKPPLDVEGALSAMTFGGAGGASIHETQLRVSASLLNNGTDVDEVVDVLLQATRAAAGEFGQRWNWVREERALRRMCADWVRKHPPAPRQAVETSAVREDRAVEEAATGTNGAAVVRLADERAKRAPKAPRQKRNRETAVQVVIADGVVEAVRLEGEDVLLTEGDVWIYKDGVWSIMSPAEEQWLRTLIQQGCDTLGYSGDTKVANSAWKRFIEHPDLFRRKVEWDHADVIVTTNGMLDFKTKSFTGYDPNRYARRKVGVAYEPGAQCPKFLVFLSGCFFDRSPGDRDALVALLQECFGSMLAIRALAREQRKALFLLGPSRTGKTQVATIARRLIGDPVASPSIMDMTKEFGLQALYGTRAWIRDDAINENDQLDPARFKTIVTGEPVDVNRKGKPYVTVSFEIPVILTTNAMPRARDATDAIYNRSIVIEMTNVVDEIKAEIERRALGFDSAAVLADALVEEEGPGILNWALEGLDRLRQRGRFDLPDCVSASIQHFKDVNNPIAEWARASLVKSHGHKIEKADLLCCLHGWQKEEHGDDAKAMGGRALYGRLKAVIPSIDLTVKTEGSRFVGGIEMSAEGLQFWESHRAIGGQLRGGSMGSSTAKSQVNKAWKASVQRKDEAYGTKF